MMRLTTPRATPAVQPPAPSVAPLVEVQRPPPLRAPVIIVTPLGELEMREGSLLVGRLHECDVVLDDDLISRMHARLSVHDGTIVVEDLHSTNGLYVNGTRITRSALLREGDRLLLGTTEISLFEARHSTVTRLRERRETGEQRLANRVIPRDARVEAPPTLPAQPGAAIGRLKLADRSSEVPSTVRVGALGVIGALAERLATSGNVDDAQRVLSSHLERILRSATAGAMVTEEVRALAARHALSLARWTEQSNWIDYVVELHLASGRTMGAETCEAFERVATSLGKFDRKLLDYYLAGLYVQRWLFTAAEREVFERLVRLSKG
jgi:pSer/pThr/pTyr-binding forkhead associated (FHA) protein